MNIKRHFRSEKERQDDFKRILISTIESGAGVSKVIEVLSIAPHFYDVTFPLKWAKVANFEALKIYFKQRDPTIDLNNPPETVEVPFLYYLLKNNFNVFAQKIIHDIDNKNPNYKKPVIFVPYKIKPDKDENGRPTMAVWYYPKYDGSEKSFDEKNAQRLSVNYGDLEFLYYANMPKMISLISREKTLDQLRPFYLKDPMILEFTKTLKEVRDIDLLNGASNLKPIVVEETDHTKNLYGYGTVLTDDETWEKMLQERAAFEKQNPHLVNNTKES